MTRRRTHPVPTGFDPFDLAARWAHWEAAEAAFDRQGRELAYAVCTDQRGGRGCGKKIARVVQTPAGPLFVAEFLPLPEDEQQPPWDREAHTITTRLRESLLVDDDIAFANEMAIGLMQSGWARHFMFDRDLPATVLVLLNRVALHGGAPWWRFAGRCEVHGRVVAFDEQETRRATRTALRSGKRQRLAAIG